MSTASSDRIQGPHDRQSSATTKSDASLFFCHISCDHNLNTATDAYSGRAFTLVSCQRTISRCAGACGNLECVTNSDLGDTQDLVNRFNVAFHSGRETAVTRRDLAHFQCAGQGAKQSTANRRDHVIERGW